MTQLCLRRLRLSHFRSYRLAEITPDAGPVVLFGANGAGKTNILEAVSLLSPGRGLRGARPQEMERQQEHLGWKVTAEINSADGVHLIETGASGDASRDVMLNGKPVPQLALLQIARVLWLVPMMDRLWLDGASERRRFLDRMVMSFVPEHAEASMIYEKAMRERNRLLKDQVTDASWHEALEAQMARAGAAITANRAMALARLAMAQQGSETAFPVADLSMVQPQDDAPVTEDDLRLALARGRSRDMAAGRSLSGPHRADLAAVYAAKNMPAQQCSTGEQKALLISLVLANARALASDFGAPPILLLDEVAAHLDEHRRAALYDEICALGSQAWMTGTGPELFQALQGRAMMIEIRGSDDGSSAARMEKDEA
jgi:DNA replication and repair protein RecF